MLNHNDEPIYTDIDPDLDVRERINVVQRFVTKGRINSRSGEPYSVERKLSKDGKRLEVTVTRATCSGCHEFFTVHSSSGACRDCGAVLCRKCMSERRCWYCNQPTCDDHGSQFSLSWEQRYGCDHHQ